MSELDFFPGFAWAVPKAFAAAVNACRFEQGDVLYSDASAYSGSRRAKKPARFHVQVLDPPRTTRALSGEGEGQRFFSNWESPVRFVWKDHGSGDSGERTVSQGRLFSCLWKGDPQVVVSDAAAECERPLLLRDLQGRIDEAAEQIAAAAGKSRGKGRAKKRHRFVFAVDQSGDASRVKAQAILRTLEARFEVASEIHRPDELALAEAARFHPTLEIVAVSIACEDASKIQDALRDVLYGGGKAGSREGSRFQLSRHGSFSEI